MAQMNAPMDAMSTLLPSTTNLFPQNVCVIYTNVLKYVSGWHVHILSCKYTGEHRPVHLWTCLRHKTRMSTRTKNTQTHTLIKMVCSWHYKSAFLVQLAFRRSKRNEQMHTHAHAHTRIHTHTHTHKQITHTQTYSVTDCNVNVN